MLPGCAHQPHVENANAVLHTVAPFLRDLRRAAPNPSGPRGRGRGDDIDPEQAEREIQSFLDAAEALDGPPVADLAAGAARILADAWTAMEAHMADVGTNKLIATMLLVSRQGREEETDRPRQWQLYAASTLLSGLIGRRQPDR